VACITLLTIFFLSLKPEVNQPPIALLASIGIGAILGFLLFNVYPARIMAGTSGSMFLGFFIATLSVIAGTKIATALLVLALPVADALWVIGERLYAGTSVFHPDERHLHYRLRKLGWTEGYIAFAFFSVTLAIAPIALFTKASGKLAAFSIVSIVLLVFLFLISRKVRMLESEKKKVIGEGV
jgi:UDP-GlcNAc:undecaprenyl-phosphate GlcNAc-1-phosphate transferase